MFTNEADRIHIKIFRSENTLRNMLMMPINFEVHTTGLLLGLPAIYFRLINFC